MAVLRLTLDLNYNDGDLDEVGKARLKRTLRSLLFYGANHAMTSDSLSDDTAARLEGWRPEVWTIA